MKTVFTLDQILAILPHRPPFLFVDRVVRFAPDRQITTEREIGENEPWFAGHFPKKAILPGVLVTDGLAQTAGLLWGFSKQARGEDTGSEPEIFYLAAANMKYTNPAYPGETLEMTATAEKHFGSFYTYAAVAVVRRRVIAKGNLTLAMMERAL